MLTQMQKFFPHPALLLSLQRLLAAGCHRHPALTLALVMAAAGAALLAAVFTAAALAIWPFGILLGWF